MCEAQIPGAQACREGAAAVPHLVMWKVAPMTDTATGALGSSPAKRITASNTHLRTE